MLFIIDGPGGFRPLALPIYRQIGARAGEANALLGLGRTLAGQGSPAAATALREAARVYDLLGRSDLAKVATREADAASPGEAGPQTG